MPTIKDIAQLAKVSVATVSYVLNDTRWVHPDKKRRVLEAIAELNYVPNAVARGLRVQKNMTIGFVVSDITNPFYPDLTKACEDVALKHGYTVNVMNTNDTVDRMEIALRQIREGKVDGLVVASALEHNRDSIQSLVEQNYPIVLVSRRIDRLRIDSVVADNHRAAELATQYLIGLGHKKIAFMGGVNGSWITVTRTNGYLHAMEEAGLQVYPEWLTPGAARYERSYEVAQSHLQLPPWKKPTAIINLTDIGALGVLDAAKDMNVAVPEELSVIGFDDLFISGTRSVQLTTVRINRYEMGSLATQLLFERMNQDRIEDFKEIVLPVELVERKTCGKAI
jgi:LacI family transcriptional regulator